MPRPINVVLAAATAATSLLAAGSAAADPPPPDPLIVSPEVSPPTSGPPLDPFAAASELTKSDPTATLTDLLTDGLAAGQGIGPSAPSPVNPLAGIGSLIPNNYRMPSGDLPSPYVLRSNVPPGPFARLDAFRGAYAVGHGALGRMPGADLGEALPGTAPPPDTRIPPGLEQFYVDPNLVPPPTPQPGP